MLVTCVPVPTAVWSADIVYIITSCVIIDEDIIAGSNYILVDANNLKHRICIYLFHISFHYRVTLQLINELYVP